MAKSIFTLFLLQLLVVQLQAQPILTSSLNPSNGTTFTAYYLDNISINVGNAGANKVWDFSNISTNYTDITDYTYYNASSTPYANKFPDANLAVEVSSSPGLYTYQKTTLTKIESMGYYSNQYSLFYSDYYIAMKYPFTYGDSYTDTYAHPYSSGTITVKADGYGTLKLPYGTYTNVLRVKTTDVGTYYTMTTYSYYAENCVGAPLMSISDNSTTKTVNLFWGVLTGNITTSLDETIDTSNDIRIMNTASQAGSISFSIIREQELEIKIYDQLGKQVQLYTKKKYTTGINKLELPQLRQGIYIIHFLDSDNKSTTFKIVR